MFMKCIRDKANSYGKSLVPKLLPTRVAGLQQKLHTYRVNLRLFDRQTLRGFA